jgi:hypothetical protein
VLDRTADANTVESVRAFARRAGKLHDGTQLLGALQQSIAELEAEVEIHRRGGEGLVEFDLALQIDLDVRRLGLHALQAAHPLVNCDATHEIAETDFGKAQTLGQQRVACNDQLGLAVTHRAGVASPSQ